MKADQEKGYVIYSRKSKFTGKGESVENQIEMCRNYIAAHFGETAAQRVRVFEDEGFSGGNLQRPQFRKMMQEAKKTPFAAVVVYRLDRISRNIGDFAGLIQELGERNIGFISIKEQFDTASPMGRAMMYIASVFSQLERETIAERIRDNMHELAKTGRWLGGNTPMGFVSEGVTKVTLEGKTKRAYKLVPVPEELRVVEMIYDKFLETGSLTGTDQYLLEGRYRTRRGKTFTRFAIRGILTNPVYLMGDPEAYEYLTENQAELFADREQFDGSRGVMAYNRTRQRAGKTNQMNPIDQWIVALGAHEGVIPGKKWVQVQTMLDRNRDKGYRRPRTNQALLSGLLYCAACGGFMRPKLSERIGAEGQRRFAYRCSMRDRSRGHVCSMRQVDGNWLDEELMQSLAAFEEDRAEYYHCLCRGRRSLENARTDPNEQGMRIREQLRQTEKDISGLADSLPRYLNTDMEGYIAEQITALHSSAENMKKRLAELETGAKRNALGEEQLRELRALMSREGLPVTVMTTEQRRNALRLLVRRITWDGNNAQVYLEDPQENEIL